MKIQKPFLLVTSLLLLPNASQAQTEWTGATDGNWDTTTDNWTGGTGNLYTDADAVQFGDSVATANLALTVDAGGVAPASVNFTDGGAGTNAYTFSGGSIGGAGALTLDSGFGGSVQLNVANSYSGGTTVNDGTLLVGNNGSLGSGTLTLAGGTFANSTGNRTLSNAINITGTTTSYAAGNLTLSGVVTGSGTLNTGGSGSGQNAASLQFADDLSGFTGTITHANVNNINNTTFLNAVDTTAKFSTSGNTSSNRTLRFNNGGTIGEISGVGGVISGNGTLNINQSTDTTYAGLLRDTAGSQRLGIVKSGTGSLTLDFANTYTEGTTLSAGTLIAADNAAFGTGAVTLIGGELRGGGATLDNSIIVDGTTSVVANTGNLILNGAITGSGTLNTGGIAPASTVVISNDLSGFTGTINHDNVNNDQNLTFTGAVNTTASFSTSGSTSSTRNLSFNAGATIGELSGTGGQLRSGGALIINQSTTTTYSGKLTNLGGTPLNLEKQGTGSLTLDFANTYTGSTTVSGGTLSAENNKALGNTTTVTVGGGTLDVRGLTAGTLTLGGDANLEFTSGTISFDLGTAFDQIVSSGSGLFDITGGTFALNLGSGFDYGDTYEVLSGFGGSNSVSGLSFTGYDDVTYTASLDTSGFLSFTPVPEPSALALLGFSVLGFCARRRRQA